MTVLSSSPTIATPARPRPLRAAIVGVGMIAAVHRRSARLAGATSRAFADIGSHWCDLVEWVSGERFSEVCAQTSITIARRPAPSGATFEGPVSDASAASEPVCTEDSAVVLLRTASAVLGSLTVSQVAAGRRNRLWFELDEADLEWLATGRHSQ